MNKHLRNTRNSELHGLTPAEEKQIQRVRAINVVTKKYAEGLKTVKNILPRLYMDTCQQLYNKPTLQLLKWVEIFDKFCPKCLAANWGESGR